MNNEELLLNTLYRLEDKVDDIAEDVKTIQLEQAEMRGVKKVVVYLATILGTLSGAVAGALGHRLGAW